MTLSGLIRSMCVPQDAWLDDCQGCFWTRFSPFEPISQLIPGRVYILILHMMVRVLSNSQGFFKGHGVEIHLKRETMSIRSTNIFPLLFLFSCSVLSDSLRSHGLQHTRLPCPSPSPGVYSNSYPLSRWCHPTISSSFIPFFCLQSFPASGSFPTSRLFASDGQSTGASTSASVLPMNIQDWFLLGLTGLIF